MVRPTLEADSAAGHEHRRDDQIEVNSHGVAPLLMLMVNSAIAGGILMGRMVSAPASAVGIGPRAWILMTIFASNTKTVTMDKDERMTPSGRYLEKMYDPSILQFARHLRIHHHVQIVAKPGIWLIKNHGDLNILIASAERVLAHLV